MQRTTFTKGCFLALFLFSYLAFLPSSLAQCPGCVVDLPTLPSDTIYLSQAPDGTVFEAYDADLSFRLPMTTTPVAANDPSIPAGLPIDEFTITGVSNLPPGLEWEANQTVFDTSVETDGCVKICGIPIESNLYFVEVEVTVVVFGIPNEASFPVSIFIAPSISTTDGFSMSNNSGCGETTVEFTNNIPSNGNPGYSYFWNFGNNTSSTDENPTSVTYNEPGTYVVEYEAMIDTIGAILSLVTVEAAGCGDIIGDPDLFIVITDPNGDEILTTGTVDDTAPPVNFVVNIPLEAGNYSLEVIDDDLIGEQSCGSVNFTAMTTGLLTDGDLEVSLNILNPIETITSSDTVYVYEIPDAPVIADPGTINCPGESVVLEIVDNNYPDNLQWYQDSTLLSGETADQLTVMEGGTYWVVYTSADGCLAESNMVEVFYDAGPAVPEFSESENVLTLNTISDLPTSYLLNWYLDGTLVQSGQETELCAEVSGLYQLEVEDLITGCINTFELDVMINPEINCAVSTLEEWLEQSIQVAPNPFDNHVLISIGTDIRESVQISLFGIDGKVYWQGFGNPGEKIEIGTSELPAGFYLLRSQSGRAIATHKLIKQ